MTTYSVEITPFDVVGEESLGFIDHVKIQYQTDDIHTLTGEQCTSKRRGNLRWERIIANLSMVANPILSNIQAQGATATKDADKFTFDVSFGHGVIFRITRDGKELVGGEAIQRVLAEALMVRETIHCTVVDPLPDGLVEKVLDLVVGSLTNDLEEAQSHITIMEN